MAKKILKSKIMRDRYSKGLCMSCGEERHSFLFPCEPMLEDRRDEKNEEEEKQEEE